MSKSLHSICRWTFNAGKGGFVPGNIRPAWTVDKLGSADMVRLVKARIKDRLPDNVKLGIELHYNDEVNEKNVAEIVDAMADGGFALAMITPGAHSHFAYGGISSLDAEERRRAEDLGRGTVEIAYGPFRRTWDKEAPPTLVLWNGSFGYDLATIGIMEMYQNLKESVATLCRYEEQKGGGMYVAFEPKPNEGHPAMLIPTVASAIVFWNRLHEEFGIPRVRKGVNKEFGHSEMIGLDHVYDTVEEIDNQVLVHMHLNSQGYNDGIVLGGPGKYDIDHGVRINGMNIAIAGLIQKAGYARWKGHDMQPRAYDNEDQAVDRVIRSVLSWEACDQAARTLDTNQLLQDLRERRSAKAEDQMSEAVVMAHGYFRKMYQ